MTTAAMASSSRPMPAFGSAADSRAACGDREHRNTDPARIDARQPCGFGIDTNGKDPAAEHHVAEDELARRKDRNRDEDRDPQTAGDSERDRVDGTA